MADDYLVNEFVGKAQGGGTATPVSQLVIPADPFRKWAGVYNLDANVVMYLSFDLPAVAGQGIPVYPKDGYEFDQKAMSKGPIYVICDAGQTAKFSWIVGG